jgi:hypothetical protein
MNRPNPPTHPWLSELTPGLYYQRWPAVFTDDALESFLESVEAVVAAQRGPFAWVVMADAMMAMSAKQRKMFSEGEARMQPQDKLYCAGTAIVLQSPIVRGIVTAVYWLTPPVYPYLLCPNEDQGRGWASKKLAERLRAEPL